MCVLINFFISPPIFFLNKLKTTRHKINYLNDIILNFEVVAPILRYTSNMREKKPMILIFYKKKIVVVQSRVLA
jgi:hypothetical protein